MGCGGSAPKDGSAVPRGRFGEILQFPKGACGKQFDNTWKEDHKKYADAPTRLEEFLNRQDGHDVYKRFKADVSKCHQSGTFPGQKIGGLSGWSYEEISAKVKQFQAEFSGKGIYVTFCRHEYFIPGDDDRGNQYEASWMEFSDLTVFPGGYQSNNGSNVYSKDRAPDAKDVANE